MELLAELRDDSCSAVGELCVASLCRVLGGTDGGELRKYIYDRVGEDVPLIDMYGRTWVPSPACMAAGTTVARAARVLDGWQPCANAGSWGRVPQR